MRKSRVAGLVFLATAALAQQQQAVEITSEPSHHLVLENDYVRVFDVTVVPKASTLIHRHDNDYLFVTLGDSNLINARVGEKPAALQLKDGDVRFTPGHFAHAAINNADRPFHNITIELLKPPTNVKTCTESCDVNPECADRASTSCVSGKKLISSDQWSVSLVTMPPSSRIEKHTHIAPHLVVPISNLDLASVSSAGDMGASIGIKRAPGEINWVSAGVTHVLYNNGSHPARFVVLEFNPEPGSPTRAGVARGGVQKP
jgi:quercetin dioxygenase-like cupin family protein